MLLGPVNEMLNTREKTERPVLDVSSASLWVPEVGFVWMASRCFLSLSVWGLHRYIFFVVIH